MADVADNTQQLDALALKAAQGDAGAYDELLELASRRLYKLARKMFSQYPRLRRWEQTDDVFQNAMLRLHRSLAEVRPDSARAFLGLAAVQIRRTLLDLARHHFGPAGSAAKHQTDPSATVLQQEVTRQERPETLAEWAHFHEIIEGLPDEEREVFHLVWYDGMSQQQVAELLQMSLRTVRRRVLAARLAIYEALRGEQPPLERDERDDQITQREGRQMNGDDQLGELLLTWDERRTAGDEPSAEELCNGDKSLAAELDRRITALKGTDWLFEEEGDTIEQTIDQSAEDTKVVSPMLTVEEFTRSLSDSGLFTRDEVRQLQVGGSDDDAAEDVASLAERLIAAGKLTNYQACVLLQKKNDPLFIDKYLILDVVGSGGMGVVFKALHKSMDRVVALKVLPKSAVDSPDKVRRFQREARAAAKLSHPNIATAHDADQWNGIHFLVMEYVAGRNLADRVAEQGPMSVAQAVNFTLQAARGLVHAHERGIVHRDIKPANLILDNDGIVKVVDMGLAAIERGADGGKAQHSTMAGTVMGTVAYMSPEQAADTTEADHRSDVYSLGATLYFLLTGWPPYHESTAMKTMLAHREAPIPSLCAARADVPQELDHIFSQMMAKDPAGRFQSAEELVTALESLAVDGSLTTPSGQNSTACRANMLDIDTTAAPPTTKTVAARQQHIAERGQTARLSRIVLAALVGLGIVLIAGAAVVFRIATDQGELIVISDDPGIEVLIKRDEHVVRNLQLEQGETKTTIRSGHYVIELRGVSADRFTLDREQITISRGDSQVVTVTRRPAGLVAAAPGPLPNSPVICKFDDEAHAGRYWVWNDEFTFSDNGAKVLQGPASYLRSRHRFTGDVAIDLDLSFGQAQFSNTGAAWITVWNKRLVITNQAARLDALNDAVEYAHNPKQENRRCTKREQSPACCCCLPCLEIGVWRTPLIPSRMARLPFIFWLIAVPD